MNAGIKGLGHFSQHQNTAFLYNIATALKVQGSLCKREWNDYKRAAGNTLAASSNKPWHRHKRESRFQLRFAELRVCALPKARCVAREETHFLWVICWLSKPEHGTLKSQTRGAYHVIYSASWGVSEIQNGAIYNCTFLTPTARTIPETNRDADHSMWDRCAKLIESWVSPCRKWTPNHLKFRAADILT